MIAGVGTFTYIHAGYSHSFQALLMSPLTFRSTFNKEKMYKTCNPVGGIVFGCFPKKSSVTCACL